MSLRASTHELRLSLNENLAFQAYRPLVVACETALEHLSAQALTFG